MANGKFVSYLRVSTERQGVSGLGLEAQRAAVNAHLNGGDWKIVAELVEVESGKRGERTGERPELVKAIGRAKLMRATLLVAKLDRLSSRAPITTTRSPGLASSRATCSTA